MKISDFALACTGLCVVYCVYRLWKHDQLMKADPIDQAIRENNRLRDLQYPLGPTRDEFAGWQEEVDRILDN